MDYAPADGLRYLFIDFNAFFAAVAQHDDPALRGRPVAIAPLESEHSIAIAASYEARAYGVTRGVRIRDARRLCPGPRREGATRPRHIMTADQWAVDLDYLGTKIAFNRIPEEEDFVL